MEQVIRGLPLRLVPRKGGQIGAIVVLLIFMAIAGFIIGQFGPWQLAASGHPAGYFILAFFALFLLIPIVWIVSAVLKLLPGSPYYYLEIAATGLVLRQGLWSKRFAWADLSPFTVNLEIHTSRDSNGRRSRTEYYYVVADPAGKADLPQDREKRQRRAAFKVLPDEYGAGSGKADAHALAAWLTEIRAAALASPGRPVKQVAVPSEFCDTALPIVMNGGAASGHRPSGGVVER
jgi:hypothetical protein